MKIIISLLLAICLCTSCNRERICSNCDLLKMEFELNGQVKKLTETYYYARSNIEEVTDENQENAANITPQIISGDKYYLDHKDTYVYEFDERGNVMGKDRFYDFDKIENREPLTKYKLKYIDSKLVQKQEYYKNQFSGVFKYEFGPNGFLKQEVYYDNFEKEKSRTNYTHDIDGVLLRSSSNGYIKNYYYSNDNYQFENDENKLFLSSITTKDQSSEDIILYENFIVYNKFGHLIRRRSKGYFNQYNPKKTLGPLYLEIKSEYDYKDNWTKCYIEDNTNDVIDFVILRELTYY